MTTPDSAVADIPYADLGMIGDYLLTCRDAGLRPRTIITKWQRLVATEDMFGVDLERASEDDARRWWRRLAGAQLSNSTRATYLSHVRALYSWAVTAHRVDADPTRRIVMPKRPRGLPRDVEPAAAAAAIAAMEPRPRMMLGLALWCGLRCFEIAPVRPSRDLVQRADGRWVLRVVGKGGTVRVVTPPAHLIADLQTVTGWAFPSRRGVARHVSAAWVSEAGGHALAEAGISATMHQLRHTFATALLARTKDLALVATQLGHASVATAQVYARAAALDPAVVETLYGPLPSSSSPSEEP